MAALIRFILIGGAGFLIDTGLTWLVIRAGCAPWQARVPALVVAMVFTWLANRRYTYQSSGTRPAVEASRYATVAVSMAAGNYLIFIALVGLGSPVLWAIVTATGCQTLVSFWAYKRFVFGGLA